MDFVGTKFYCLHATAHSNCCIRIATTVFGLGSSTYTCGIGCDILYRIMTRVEQNILHYQKMLHAEWITATVLCGHEICQE